MLKDLSDRPKIEILEQAVERMVEARGHEIEFIVLFGSMAKGNWSLGSDYDVLVGLTVADELRFIDRIGEFDSITGGFIETFPYDRPAWERMFAGFNLLFLEALADGVVLVDRGAWARMHDQFLSWRADGTLTRLPRGWSIAGPGQLAANLPLVSAAFRPHS